MKITTFVRAGAALVLLSASATMADMVPLDGQSARGKSVPPSMGEVFGTLGGDANKGGGGTRSGDGLFDSGGVVVQPTGSGGVTNNGINNPTMVPLPPALISGLVGLAAVGIIGRLRRRSLAH
jgi:hypothetical protein